MRGSVAGAACRACRACSSILVTFPAARGAGSWSTSRALQRVRSLRRDALELAHAAARVPIHHVEVALLVPVGAVRRKEHAVLPLVLRDAVLRAQRFVGLIAELAHELVLLVE